MQSDFYSKENFLFVLDIFDKYMEKTYSINLNKIESEASIKKRLFEYMSEINENPKTKNMSLDQKNIQLLTKAKQVFLKELQLTDKSNKKPNIHNLSRDKDIYGQRPLVVQDNRPEIDPYSKRPEAGTTMERVMMDRYKTLRDEEVGLVKPKPDPRIMAPRDKDQPVPESDFNQRIKDLESARALPPQQTMGIMDQRNRVEFERNEATSIETQDPKRIFEMVQNQQSMRTMKSTFSDTDLAPRKDLLIPRNQKHVSIPRFLSLNSFDREWTRDTFRYKYTINLLNKDTDIMKKYKNIESIAVSKVIIPEEVISANSVINKEKTAFNYEFSFAYPYLLLAVDEFTDVYDGTNQFARRAFATLVYHRHYKAPNGRGYIILKPIQEEKKIFYPTLLSTLPRLTLSLTKPNGDLFNKSKDNYKIFKIDYEAFNPQYLKIVTDIYFDKNEFYAGDTCNFIEFTMPETSQYNRDLMMFINRHEGHEIKEIGCANDWGYFKTFYIEAPGSFNTTQGRFEVNMNLINALNTYNAGINFVNLTTTNGFIMNASLQNTITMKLDVAVDDARIFDTQLL